MSYNQFVNNITSVNDLKPKNKDDNDILVKNISTREEKLDAILESKVVDKYKQKWRELTKFLKNNRIRQYVNRNENLSEIEKESLVKNISNQILTGKLKNSDIVYDSENGLIDSIKGFSFE